jgi:hypothetical protein
MLTPEEITAYAAVMRREGIVSLKCEGLEIIVQPGFRPSNGKDDTQRPPEEDLDDYQLAVRAAKQDLGIG